MNESKDTTSNMPFWVLLAFSSLHKRKHALILIWSCILFTLYSFPWATFIENEFVAAFFLIDDWSWIAMMIPVCFWYLLSLRWMDNNNGWENF